MLAKHILSAHQRHPVCTIEGLSSEIHVFMTYWSYPAMQSSASHGLSTNQIRKAAQAVGFFSDAHPSASPGLAPVCTHYPRWLYCRLIFLASCVRMQLCLMSLWRTSNSLADLIGKLSGKKWVSCCWIDPAWTTARSSAYELLQSSMNWILSGLSQSDPRASFMSLPAECGGKHRHHSAAGFKSVKGLLLNPCQAV